ncbi:MAG: endopeptidase La [Deltaproteobacteria bacterium]|nr:endopeptidase La [Deltaproteobacteria bacterium]
MEEHTKQEENTSDTSPKIPDVLPILPVRDIVIFPMTIAPIIIGQPKSIRLLEEVSMKDRLFGLVSAKSTSTEDLKSADLYSVGTLARIFKLIKSPDGTLRVLIQGIERIRVDEWMEDEPYLKAKVSKHPEILSSADDIEAEAMARSLAALFAKLAGLVPHLSSEEALTAVDVSDSRRLVYLVASSIQMGVEEAQEILELDSIAEKIRRLSTRLSHEMEVVELGQKIQSQARSEIEKTQREYLLREQLKAIQRELGEKDELQVIVEEYREKIAKANMPEEANKEALRELSRLEKLPSAAAEYSVIQTYLDWMISLPWSSTTDDVLQIAHARQVLDEDHYDLEKVKERILEYLAVRKLRQDRAKESNASTATDEPVSLLTRPERKGAILCFVGPPGVGKTSLGLSIARAMGRKFTRMSLGGMRDEAEIRGHRRTYIGAMPGRIIEALHRVNSKNPVIMLDEVDKIGSDWRGDPSSALLEVLDPEQNRDFRDHYLDVPFDLSEVMFITTANILDTIPSPLRDRMEVLELSGYIEEEKLHIATKYIIPRQVKENGLHAEEVVISDEAIRAVIRDYTREAGVRELERQIGAICRKIATAVAEGRDERKIIDCANLADYLGKQRYFFEAAERTEFPGVATGLAMTSVGGDIIFIEATRMPGKGGLVLTGQLDDVMKESAQIALSYVRSQADVLGLEPGFSEKNDIHIHVPAGAVPKDGPSAGITIATALASLLTNRCVRRGVCMTGEITLRGKVLPVGGIKEKVLAAHRAGLDTVILPKRNEKDLEDLPSKVREELRFVLVDEVVEVFKNSFDGDIFHNSR